MTQSIVLQVGQCGNQVGCRFWDLVLREHMLLEDASATDNAVWNFFRMAENGKEFRARAVMVDMEEGVINSILRTQLGRMLSNHQFVTDVSGSGNNWAVGFHEYGRKYRDKIAERIRKEAEHCSCLQTFFLLHSLGGGPKLELETVACFRQLKYFYCSAGHTVAVKHKQQLTDITGTGSGLGTAVLEMLNEEFPKVFRFDMPVFPSAMDDVVTSPYNTVFALEKITEFADFACPVENEALIDICNRIIKVKASTKQSIASSAGSVLGQKARPFDQMNNIVANLLLHLTSSARFSGMLNMDMNEICTNLVPHPKLHYLVSSITPLYSLLDVSLPPRRLDQMFTDAFSPHHQLVNCDVKGGTMLSCALLARGKVCMADMRRNLDRVQEGLKFVYWNQSGWKTGLCSTPPVQHPYALLTLSNTSSFHHVLSRLRLDFLKLYNRKAHTHHFLQVPHMEESHFREALASLTDLSADYRLIEVTDFSKLALSRIKILNC